MFFKNMSKRSIFERLRKAVSAESVSKNETPALIYEIAEEIIAEAERNSFSGDLWEIMFALTLVEDDNSLWRTFERSSVSLGSILPIAANNIWNQHKIIIGAKSIVNSEDEYETIRPLTNYFPANGASGPSTPALSDVMIVAKRIAEASAPRDMLSALTDFYELHGAGIYALNYAFRWSGSDKKLVPLNDLDQLTLDALVGYEDQKRSLLANTEAFLNGMPSNNVLLYGDSGTGKSSSVRALLNEPTFIQRGLRIIELHKEQFADIPDLLDMIRGRNYKFILFMDDLSFEEFEVEYKHLKALIEGGLERRPQNVVIYATSNRRNLIREVWADRRISSDDVHGWDTMQEKLSLADRFGITIWYGAVNKAQYMDIVKACIAEVGLSMNDAELEKLALRWEIDKGNFTGRAARQFAYSLLSEG
ncbi:MAG: ATP-binding protein [Synergistaceae bacterium]|nr:ATP-binding protein [Synergistaceae bacterium]